MGLWGVVGNEFLMMTILEEDSFAMPGDSRSLAFTVSGYARE